MDVASLTSVVCEWGIRYIIRVGERCGSFDRGEAKRRVLLWVCCPLRACTAHLSLQFHQAVSGSIPHCTCVHSHPLQFELAIMDECARVFPDSLLDRYDKCIYPRFATDVLDLTLRPGACCGYVFACMLCHCAAVGREPSSVHVNMGHTYAYVSV